MKCGEIIAQLEKIYPRFKAVEWDNPGLLAGRREKEVKRIYIALDATDKIISAAVTEQADMLLTHHPLIMGAIKSVNTDDFIGRRLVELIRSDISYYAMHTNYDVVTMAPLSGKMLGLSDAEVMNVLFTENGHSEGIGQVGALPQEMTLRACAEYVKDTFGLETVKVFGDMDQIVSRAAISPGSGKGMAASAIAAKADVLISGDIGHHDGIDAQMQGLAIIDAGHYGLEHIFIQQMEQFISENFEGIEVICEEIENPFKVI